MHRTVLTGLTFLSGLALSGVAFAGETLVARSYDVSTLVRSSDSRRAPALGLHRSFGGGGGVLSFDEEDPKGELIVTGQALQRFLLQELTRAQAPKATHLLLTEGNLEVLAPLKTHQELQASLARVRAQVAREISLEVRLVALDSAQAPALGSAGLVLEPKHHALLAGGTSLGGVRFAARDRQPASGALLQRSTFLGDFEVNQTGTIPVLNSVVERLLEGLVAEVTCRLPLGEGPALLDCRVEHARQPGPARTLPFPGAGSLDLPSLDHLALSGSLRLRPGQTGLLGLAPLPSASGKSQSAAVLVSLRAVQARPALAAKGAGLRIYDLSRSAAPESSYFSRPGWVSDSGLGGGGGGVMTFGGSLAEEGPEAAFMSVNAIRELALSKVEPGNWASDNGSKENWIVAGPGSISVAQSGAGHARLAAFLETLQPTPALLRYELSRLELAQTPDASPVLSAEAAAALLSSNKVLERLSLSALPGRGVEVASRRERRFLADIERAGGGCNGGTSAVQVDDPIIETLAAGLSLRLSGAVSGEEINVRASLDLRGPATLRPTQTQWGVVELYSASHRELRRRATLRSGGGLLLTTQIEGKARTYLLRVWADE